MGNIFVHTSGRFLKGLCFWVLIAPRFLLNGGIIEDPSPEVQEFIALFPSFLAEGLQIYRTELNVYSAELNVAGQIDALFVDSEGFFVILDWKRSARISFDSNREMLPPLDHLPDCNGYHYAIQLNLYRFMLEAQGFRVSRMYLCAFPQARVIEVPRGDEEIGIIIDVWAQDARRSVLGCFGKRHGSQAQGG